MTSGGEPSSLADMVECDICMEVMTRPQALNCLHHICKACCDQLQRFREEGKIVVSCPSCREFTPESTIKDSFMMQKLLDMYDKKQTNQQQENKDIKQCMQCDRINITSLCCECNIELCDSCKIGHLRIPSCKDHSIVIIGEKGFSEKMMINISKYCSKHPMYPIKYSCVPCNVALCSECKVEEHDIHQTESVENALKKMLALTNTHINTIHGLKSEVEKQISQVRKLKGECQSMCDVAKNNIQQHTEILMAKVEADSQELKEVVEAQNQAKIKELKLMESDLENQLASQSSLLSWSNTIVRMTEGPGVLCELQGGLYQRIKACANEPAMIGPTEVQMPEVEFTPTNVIPQKNSVGKLETKNKPVHLQPVVKIRQNLVSGRTTPAQSSSPSPLGVPLQPAVRPRQWPVSAKTTTAQRPAVSDTDIVSFRTTTTDLTTLSSKPFTKTGSFELNRGCRRMCYYRGNFWCLCYKDTDSCIDVYSTSGQLVNTVQSPQIKDPWSVHPINNQQLILAAWSGLFVINIAGTVYSKILDGEFHDVHINKNSIAALQKMESNQDEVHLLHNTDPPTVHSHFSLDNNNSKCVMIADQHIYVSFHQSKKQSYVAQYSHTGVRLCQYGSYGRGGQGLLDLPFLCTLDSQGSLLVADCLNKHIQVLDSRGQWSVLNHLKMDMYPKDIVFTGDTVMWVLCYNATEKRDYLQKYEFE